MKIELLDHCASDLAVVNAARVSLDKWHDEMEQGDDKLIHFLLKNHHGTPFEHGHFRFRVEAPIFVFREWHRHRVGHSYNEMSGRYTEMEKLFYMPDCVRVQTGKPGAYTFEERPQMTGAVQTRMIRVFEEAWSAYEELLAQGVAKEQARIVLPLALYSKMIWSCNPRSLMHFVSLRADEQAMEEIRTLANAAAMHFDEIMPVTSEAFFNNGCVAP
jgi:thymidylate synthase (FAD)